MFKILKDIVPGYILLDTCMFYHPNNRRRTMSRLSFLEDIYKKSYDSYIDNLSKLLRKRREICITSGVKNEIYSLITDLTLIRKYNQTKRNEELRNKVDIYRSNLIDIIHFLRDNLRILSKSNETDFGLDSREYLTPKSKTDKEIVIVAFETALDKKKAVNIITRDSDLEILLDSAYYFIENKIETENNISISSKEDKEWGIHKLIINYINR